MKLAYMQKNNIASSSSLPCTNFIINYSSVQLKKLLFLLNTKNITKRYSCDKPKYIKLSEQIWTKKHFLSGLQSMNTDDHQDIRKVLTLDYCWYQCSTKMWERCAIVRMQQSYILFYALIVLNPILWLKMSELFLRATEGQTTAVLVLQRQHQVSRGKKNKGYSIFHV